MRSLFRIKVLVPLVMLALIGGMQGVRLHRVQQLTALPEWSVDSPTLQASSPTGYASGVRAQIVTDPTGQSQQWIAQVQQMLQNRTWKIDRVDYDNAPFGRETRLPSFYRLWLGLLSSIHGTFTSLPLGAVVEKIALYSDPLLQFLIACATACFVHRSFGWFSALTVTIALVTVYPLATNFLPGAPNSQGLTEAGVLWSVLPIAAAVWSTIQSGKMRRSSAATYFFVAGAIGGIGLSLNLNTQLSVLVGLVIGALAMTRLARGQEFVATLPWRMWALGGSLTSLASYLWEYYPARMTLRLDANHPLYALGWLATGELLVIFCQWNQPPPHKLARHKLIVTGIATLLLIGAVFIWATHRSANFRSDLSITQLTRLGEGISAITLSRWLSADGFSLRVWAVFIPAVLLLWTCFRLLNRNGLPARRAALVLTLGPILVTLGFAVVMLRWWNTFESVALVALAVGTASQNGTDKTNNWRWGLGIGAIAWLGLIQLLPSGTTYRGDEFTPTEMQSVMERDLAHWLAQRHPGAVVLAPPALTSSLGYYGGLRGITTVDVDNGEGLLGAMRIAGALTQQEALALIQRREVTYLVLPSWDTSLDQAARESAGTPKSIFIEQLRDSILPGWIRPIAYFSPAISGFESRSLTVLEVVEVQTEATLLSQMATYFVEAGLPGHATELRKIVRRFPTDLSALIALVEIETMREDQPEYVRSLAAVISALEGGADRTLAWDRRIALAAILSQGNHADLARIQITRCFEQVNETRLRYLTPKSLFRFLALGHNFKQQIADPQLRDLASKLLPPESRQKLQ